MDMTESKYKHERKIRRLNLSVDISSLFDNQNPRKNGLTYYGRISGVEVKLKMGSDGYTLYQPSILSARTEKGLNRARNSVLDRLCGVRR